MTTNELHQGSPNIQRKTQFGGRWLGAAAGLAAVAAIAIAIYLSLPGGVPAASRSAQLAAAQRDNSYQDGVDRAARRSALAAQSVADAARRDELARIKDEGIPAGQIVPDAAQQGVNSYIRAHDDPAYHAPASADQSFRTPQTSDYHYVPTLGQVVPDASTQGVMDYLHGHGAGLPAQGQVVPDAAMQGVMDYLHGHGAGLPAQHQAVPDAAQQGVDGYIAAHSAAADPSFRTPQTSDYQYVPTVGPDAADRTMLHDLQWPGSSQGSSQASSGQAVPDAATQGVLSYLRAHGAAVSTR